MAADGRESTEVLCLGETMVLLVPDPPAAPADAETFRRHLGGAESNVAVHLARAGHDAVWQSALGDDAFGRFIEQRLSAEGVRCDVRLVGDRPTGVYFKELEPDGTRVRYYRAGSAASTLDATDAKAALARQPGLVHTSGITAAISPEAHRCVSALLDADPRPTISFDVNYRPLLHGDHNAELLLSLARRADIVFCGVDEAAALWGCRDVDDVRRLLTGPDTVVVKQGPDGATAFRGGRSWHQPALPVTVVDAVGAGDAFAAGYLDGVLSGAGFEDSLLRGVRLAREALQVPGDLAETTRADVTEEPDG
jgi:2-dehydro-3-deoxygluconokinase